uniref:Uncharacterized protein n=1 Tax=Siphoviridae sp. ctv4j104 TaxID=2826510 RepID=A0A8S5MAA6_9CAUD|nr:MAG TPA: hypothetical protein [Siphoviridae sp. ctv4j104]
MQGKPPHPKLDRPKQPHGERVTGRGGWCRPSHGLRLFFENCIAPLPVQLSGYTGKITLRHNGVAVPQNIKEG